MSMDLAEAEEMLATSRRFPELVTMLCPPPFGLRGDLLVKKLLAENYLGRPHHIRLQSFTGDYLNADAAAHWRQRIEISGLNVLALGIYVEVLQRWLGDITGVYARGKILHRFGRATKSSCPTCSPCSAICERRGRRPRIQRHRCAGGRSTRSLRRYRHHDLRFRNRHVKPEKLAIVLSTRSKSRRTWKASGLWRTILSKR